MLLLCRAYSPPAVAGVLVFWRDDKTSGCHRLAFSDGNAGLVSASTLMLTAHTQVYIHVPIPGGHT